MSDSAFVIDQQDLVLQLVTEQGMAGPPGKNGKDANGNDAFGYDHAQPQAASTWTIAHNRGQRPSVSTFNVGGVEIEGAVQHLSPDVLIVQFVVPVAGYAHVI